MMLLVVFILVFLLFAMLRVPVAMSLGIGSLAAFMFGGLKLDSIPTAFMAGLDSFPLLAIPAFVFAGDIMGQGGISKAIINFFMTFFGRFRGSLGTVLVATAMLFGSITGSSVATVSAVGGIMVPEMLKNGYDKKYVTALLASSGFLGILIPPSVPGIMFALMTGQKVTDVWICTLVPGLVLGFLFMIVNYYSYGKKQPKNTEPFVFEEFKKQFKASIGKAVVAFIMPVIIFGGVYGGFFTATEAGAISVFYGLFAGWIIYPIIFKSKADGKLSTIIAKSAVSCAAIALIVSTATLVGRMVSMGGIVQIVTEFLMSVTDSKIVFLILVNIVLLICGMFLETNTSVLIFAPLLTPIAQAYGVSAIHFAAIMLLNLEIGCITPPFAANLFVGCKLTKTNMNEIIKPLLPFYFVCFIVLLITTYIPEFSGFLVGI